jgi:hypothetical protein
MSPGEVLDAVSVRLTVRNSGRAPRRTVTADLAARYALLNVSSRGFSVSADFVDARGRIVARGNAEHRPA